MWESTILEETTEQKKAAKEETTQPQWERDCSRVNDSNYEGEKASADETTDYSSSSN